MPSDRSLICSTTSTFPTLHHHFYNFNNDTYIIISLDADIAALAHSQEEQPVLTAVINRSSSLNDIEGYRSSDLSTSAFLLSFVRSAPGTEEQSHAMDLTELNIGCLSRLDSIDMNMNIGTFSHATAGKRDAYHLESLVYNQIASLFRQTYLYVIPKSREHLAVEVEVVSKLNSMSLLL
jgi:hypothetical protein